MLGRGRACQERGQEFTSGWKRPPHRASPTEAEFCLFGPRLPKDSAWHVADSHWTARRGDEGTSNSPGHREKRLQRRQREETDGAGCSQGARGRRRPWPWSRGPRRPAATQREPFAVTRLPRRRGRARWVWGWLDLGHGHGRSPEHRSPPGQPRGLAWRPAVKLGVCARLLLATRTPRPHKWEQSQAVASKQV